VHHVRRWCTDAGFLVFLLGIERSPFRTAVDRVLLDNESAVVTDRLAVFVVCNQRAATLWEVDASRFFLLFDFRRLLC
jgi:hypothetical protein